MSHEDMLISSSLWRPSSRSPTFRHGIPSPTPSPAPVFSRLEHYRSRQEAAISFEDDLEFNPSLTSEELNDAHRTLSNLVSSLPPLPPSPPRASRASRNSSPMFSSTRAIPIIDPSNKAPLSLPNPPPRNTRSPPPHQYLRSNTTTTTPATAFSSIFSPSLPLSDPYSPTPTWAATWDLGMKPQQSRVPGRSIAIVDPNSGNILNASPERRPYYAGPTPQQRMVNAGPAGWFDVTVR